ncbi:hypothetical protein LTR04_002956, partial [Oleoguttula sp. CCFEE 6159]
TVALVGLGPATFHGHGNTGPGVHLIMKAHLIMEVHLTMVPASIMKDLQVLRVPQALQALKTQSTLLLPPHHTSTLTAVEALTTVDHPTAAATVSVVARHMINSYFNINPESDREEVDDPAISVPVAAKTDDFVPAVDVFDTESAFVVHVSLAGAKKEDVGVNWDDEKNELIVAGVIHRPGDEDFLKTLALDERRIGAFERKVTLGSRAKPAQIDVDAITAKMEDGVLRVEVPKQDRDYVEIRKVDIE